MDDKVEERGREIEEKQVASLQPVLTYEPRNFMKEISVLYINGKR